MDVLPEVCIEDIGARRVALSELVSHSLQYYHGNSFHRRGLCDLTGVVMLSRHFGHKDLLFQSV